MEICHKIYCKIILPLWVECGSTLMSITLPKLNDSTHPSLEQFKGYLSGFLLLYVCSCHALYFFMHIKILKIPLESKECLCYRNCFLVSKCFIYSRRKTFKSIKYCLWCKDFTWKLQKIKGKTCLYPLFTEYNEKYFTLCDILNREKEA